MANRIGGSILLALILIGTALVVFLCAKNRGRLTIGGKTLQLFPDGFNSLLFYFICVLWAIVLIACLLFGSGFAYLRHVRRHRGGADRRRLLHVPAQVIICILPPSAPYSWSGG